MLGQFIVRLPVEIVNQLNVTGIVAVMLLAAVNVNVFVPIA